MLDQDSLVDLRDDATDYPEFETARDFAVEVLECVLGQLTDLVDQLREAGRFEDLELGWWERLITRVGGPR